MIGIVVVGWNWCCVVWRWKLLGLEVVLFVQVLCDCCVYVYVVGQFEGEVGNVCLLGDYVEGWVDIGEYYLQCCLYIDQEVGWCVYEFQEQVEWDYYVQLCVWEQCQVGIDEC